MPRTRTPAATAALHLRFESIHPLIDGNGRTGRLVMNPALMRAGPLPVNIKFADQRKSDDCFDRYAAEQSIAPMCELIGGYEEEALKDSIAMVQGAAPPR